MDDKILRRLDEWQIREGVSPDLISFYKHLLEIQTTAETNAEIPTPSIDPETISARMEHGSSLLKSHDIRLDWDRVKQIYSEVASLFAHYPGLFGPIALGSISLSSSQLKEIFALWLDEGKIPAPEESDGVSGAVWTDIINAAFKPFLRHYASNMKDRVNQDRWRRSFCPVCAGSPDFAYLDDSGARWLVCSRCDFEWLFQRLECPYCGNLDQAKLYYLTDDVGKYRLYVCDQCKRYIKTIDKRQSKESNPVSLERLFTLNIDLQARDSGYSP